MLKISLLKSEGLLLLTKMYLQDFILQQKNMFSTLQISSVRPQNP